MRSLFILALAAFAAAAGPVVPAVIPDADIVPLGFLLCHHLVKQFNLFRMNPTDFPKWVDSYNTNLRHEVVEKYYSEENSRPEVRREIHQGLAKAISKITPAEKARLNAIVNSKNEYPPNNLGTCEGLREKYNKDISGLPRQMANQV